jgi:gliding motility-associated-like protein
MTVTSTNACASQTATATYSVIVNPLPTAIAGGTTTICSNETATVSGASSANGTISWVENGAGSITSGATTLAPVYTAASGDAGNTVTLTMTVTSNNVCTPATATAIFTVNVDQLPTATAGGSQTICENGTATVSGASSTNGTVLWTHNGLGTLANATTLTPTYTAAAGDAGNTVTLTMSVTTTATCAPIPAPATATYSIIVNPLPTATITATQLVVCKNSTEPQVTFTGATGTAPYTFTYNINGGTTQTITTTSGSSVSVNVPTTIVGSFAYNLIDVTDASTTTCSNVQTGSVSVTVNALPIASISGSTSICEGGTTPITFTGTPNSIVSYSFNNGATQTITLDGSGNGSLTSSALTSDGTYNLISVATNATPSCSQIQSGAANIVVVSYPSNPTVSSNVTYCIGEPIANMTATSNSGGVLIWYSDANLTDSLGVGSIFTPEAKTATFYITEMTPYPYCESSPSAISIIVQDCEVDVPTAFTPDGDQVNDTWVISNLDAIYPKSIVRIYNRWGNIVFESTEGNYEQNPWDGKFNLEDLPVASYYYFIEYNDGKHDPKKGIITIIRK